MGKNKSYLTRTSITICDNAWKVFFKDDKQYRRAAPKGSRAFCDTSRKEIHFNCSHVVKGDGVVAHELMHAYIAELQGHDLNMSRDVFEEFVCTMMESRALQLLKKAKPLTRILVTHAKRLKAKRIPDNQQEEDDE